MICSLQTTIPQFTVIVKSSFIASVSEEEDKSIHVYAILLRTLTKSCELPCAYNLELELEEIRMRNEMCTM